MRRRSIEFIPKVSAAIDLAYDLLRGNKYDSIYAKPMRTIYIGDVAGSTPNRDPLAIVGTRISDEVHFVHPKFVGGSLFLATCRWLEEKWWDQKKSDPFLYDALSNWHIVLRFRQTLLGTAEIFDSGMTLYVGVTHIASEQPRVNSYAMLARSATLSGNVDHGLVLLPRH